MELKLILTILAIGVGLAGTGQLPKATHALMKLAIDAQKNDVVSLGAWNRELLKEPRQK